MSHIESFSCQSHLYMSFLYSECLFHQNNLNLDLYHLEKSFHLGIRWIKRNLIEIELKVVSSHFKTHKFFMKLKVVFERNLIKKISEASCSSLPASNTEGLCVASNEICRLCFTFANFPFFLSFFACLKSSFLISIVSSLKSSLYLIFPPNVCKACALAVLSLCPFNSKT